MMVRRTGKRRINKFIQKIDEYIIKMWKYIFSILNYTSYKTSDVNDDLNV